MIPGVGLAVAHAPHHPQRQRAESHRGPLPVKYRSPLMWCAVGVPEADARNTGFRQTPQRLASHMDVAESWKWLRSD
jgi:hypothetical protein